MKKIHLSELVFEMENSLMQLFEILIEIDKENHILKRKD